MQHYLKTRISKTLSMKIILYNSTVYLFFFVCHSSLLEYKKQSITYFLFNNRALYNAFFFVLNYEHKCLYMYMEKN